MTGRNCGHGHDLARISCEDAARVRAWQRGAAPEPIDLLPWRRWAFVRALGLEPPFTEERREWIETMIADAEADLVELAVERADLHPGDGDGQNLKDYWLHGEGLAKWATSPHPWTSLYNHLKKHMTSGKAKRVASQWFHDHFGYWPGDRKGKNPVGHG